MPNELKQKLLNVLLPTPRNKREETGKKSDKLKGKV